MQRKQILINAIMSVVQILVISGVLFVLYRFLLKTIGVEQLGIWSLVLATTAVSQIANMGLSGSVVKFVAKYVAKRESGNISAVIQTAALSVSVFMGCILLISYPIAKWILKLVIPYGSFHYALAILPYAFFSLWMTVICSIFQAGLDGYQRIDIRCMLLMGGAIFHLILCFILAPTHGLMGLAYARVIQNATILFSSWLFLKKYLPFCPIFPYKWNKTIFREIIGYGINFQIMSITRMFYDPITKALLSKFGGLAFVGYYEMANRMIRQLRDLIVSANGVLVPAIADLNEKTPEKIQSVYLTSYQLVLYLALPLCTLCLLSLPIVSQLWIGHYEKMFVMFGVLLSVSWCLNTLGAPASFVYLGLGDLRWNVVGHVVIALLNAGLGFLFGLLSNGIGVVVAWSVSLVSGSSIICLSYHIKYRIPLAELLPRASRWVIGVCLFGILSALLINHTFNHISDTVIVNGMIVFLFSLIIFFPLWFHPMRKRLTKWFIFELLNKTPVVQ
jgi:O-antigen/teichoic acid export membrane protein